MTETVDHPTEFSARLFGFADSGDVDGFLGLVADDIHLRFGNGPWHEGKEAVRHSLTRVLSSIAGMRHTVLNEWRIGDDVIIHELAVTYTRHDGSRVTIPAATIYRLTGELISVYQIYIDLAPLYARDQDLEGEITPDGSRASA